MNIIYNADSIFNPVGDISLYIFNNKDLYYKYRCSEFIGPNSSDLNQQIHNLIIPYYEHNTVGKYQEYIDLKEDIILPPTITVNRPVYILESITDNVYKQIKNLDIREEYLLYMINNIPLYVGSEGAFLLKNSPNI